MKRQATDWKKISVEDTFNKGFISDIYRTLKTQQQKTNKWAKDMIKHFTKENNGQQITRTMLDSINH